MPLASDGVEGLGGGDSVALELEQGGPLGLALRGRFAEDGGGARGRGGMGGAGVDGSGGGIG